MARAFDFNNIRFLIDAADRGSFSAAARALGVPPSLVSRKVARLEEDVGARLFQRTTRSLTLTEAGKAFLEHARAGIHAFELAHDVVGDSAGVLRGKIRLSAPAGFGRPLWAMLARFLALHPGVRVEVELADRYVDLIEERFDMAIRASAESHGERLVGRRLFHAPRALFASPKYLKARGTPRTVAELADHDCVILGPRSERVTWSLRVGSGVQNVIVSGRIAVNEGRLATECTADGFGIGFLSRALAASYVASGKLVSVLPSATSGDVGMWLVYPDRHLAAACRALVDHLHAEFRAWVKAGAAID